MREASPQVRSYYFFNLGCPKNLVDAERVAARLECAGWVAAPSPHDAGLLVVTTCAFIYSAEEESVEEILRVASEKEDWQRLAVLGCLVSREGARLPPLLPEVEIFLGVGEMERLADAVSSGASVPRGTGAGRIVSGRILFTPPHIAYLKIADGCSNHCTYCTIPSIRGELSSRPKKEIVAEAALLARAGVRELVVIAQDTGAWGRDCGGGEEVYGLLEDVSSVFAPGWVRLLYLHPLHVDGRRILDIVRSGAICPYLDIPIQHVADGILRRMSRGYGRAELEELFGTLRSEGHDVTLRTTVMVGFPGETDREFEELVDFLAEVSFDHVGVFTYSAEEGTGAASLGYKIRQSEALRRKDIIVDLQMDISQERLSARVGGVETVLVDGVLADDEKPYPGVWGVGRIAGQAYEIDGVTYLSGGVAGIGEFVPARIERAEAYDVFATVDQDFD